MKKYLFGALTLFLLGFSGAYLIADDDHESDLLERDDLLFVSLGSYCEPNRMLRYCDLRKEAFPFDWIVSFDGEGVIELLENDFHKLFNDANFFSFGPAGSLIEIHYHLEFLHDGNFNHNFAAQFEDLKKKYTRWIERFKSLDAYKGKVVFIRNANIYSTTDPHRYHKFESNIEITDEFALRLYRALQVVFPLLDFDLAIINCGNVDGVVEEKQIEEHVKVYRTDPYMIDNERKIENYRKFFHEIMEDNVRVQGG